MYQHKYDEAFKCFEQAFNDETNPYSKELILENYLYAKGFLAKDFEESIIFFENQIKQSEINHETCKMLAEMYFANQNYSKCVRLCEKVLKKIVYKKEKFLYISLDIMYMSCLKKINKFTWKQIWGCWSRIENYGSRLGISRDDILIERYRGTRVDYSTIEREFGANSLEENEYNLVMGTLDKVVQHESFETMAKDDGLEYKKYTPKQKGKNWFSSAKYRNKCIMKIRCNDIIRAFGYRKGDQFKILRIERDHKISNYG